MKNINNTDILNISNSNTTLSAYDVKFLNQVQPHFTTNTVKSSLFQNTIIAGFILTSTLTPNINPLRQDLTFSIFHQPVIRGERLTVNKKNNKANNNKIISNKVFPDGFYSYNVINKNNEVAQGVKKMKKLCLLNTTENNIKYVGDIEKKVRNNYIDLNDRKLRQCAVSYVNITVNAKYAGQLPKKNHI